MNIDHEPVDLSAVDAFADPVRLEHAIGRVMARGAPLLARRAAARGVLPLLAGWARPALAMAATVAAVSVGALASTGGSATAPTSMPAPVAEALGLPAPVSEWLVEGRDPVASDLIVALEGMP